MGYQERTAVKIEGFTVTCERCGEEAVVAWDDNAACGNEECCGSRSVWLNVTCWRCKRSTMVYPD